MRRIRTYEVSRIDTDKMVPLTDAVDGTVWERANVARLDEYTWGDEPGPETTVRALFSAEALYLQFHVEDDKITADVTGLNGPTFEDSSVELFATPSPPDDDSPGWYCNLEANCCGTFKLAWQEPNWRERDIGRDLVSATDAAAVEVETSVPGPTKTASPDDDARWLATRLPRSTLQSLIGLSFELDPEMVWRGNFYRSGLSDAQKGTWNRTELPEPAYHSPAHFGRIEFE